MTDWFNLPGDTELPPGVTQADVDKHYGRGRARRIRRRDPEPDYDADKPSEQARNPYTSM